jgi:putative transposase
MNTKPVLEVFLNDKIRQQRIRAINLFLNGEKPESICTSLGRSKSWLYKWIQRHHVDDLSWSESGSRQPHHVVNSTPKEIEEIIEMSQLKLYNLS